MVQGGHTSPRRRGTEGRDRGKKPLANYAGRFTPGKRNHRGVTRGNPRIKSVFPYIAKRGRGGEKKETLRDCGG